MPKDPDDYKKNRAWYLAREASPEGVRKRVERERARTQAVKSGKLNGPDDPRTVDHKRPLSKGGTNAASNLRIMSGAANRRKYDR